MNPNQPDPMSEEQLQALAVRDRRRLSAREWDRVFDLALRAISLERDLAALRAKQAIDQDHCDRMTSETGRLAVENRELREALEFYADPETYFAIGFFPDPPCGEFMEDFDQAGDYYKPGKHARAALAPKSAEDENG